MNKTKINQSILASFFSIITIGFLALLTYKTDYGIFLIASFGSTMVLLYGYPESPLLNRKIYFWSFINFFGWNYLFKFYSNANLCIIPIAVGLGAGLMILLNVTHPPAGGNPIIVIIGSVSYDYLITPVILGSIIVIVFGVLINKIILKKQYPK